MFHKKRGNMFCSALEHSWLGCRSKPDKPLDADRQVERLVGFRPFKNYAATDPLGPPVSLLEAAERSRSRELRERRFVICLMRFRLNWRRIDGDAADTAKRERLYHRMPSDGEGAARLGGTAVEHWVATSSEFRSPTTRPTQAAT